MPAIIRVQYAALALFGAWASAEDQGTPLALTTAVGKPIGFQIALPTGPKDGVVSKTVIFGGAVASRRYPWLASLQALDPLDSNKFLHQCGGVLIAPSYVLTAAHCQTQFDRVCLGGRNLMNLNQEFECHGVSRHIIHSGFGGDSFINDIQLVKLDSPSNIKPVKLNNDPFAVVPGADVIAVGWGISEGSWGRASQELRTLDLKLASPDTCSDFRPPIPDPLVPGMICDVGTPGRGTCNGDSGGPLLLQEENTVVGITSFGSDDCTLGYPTIYTNVLSYIPWIEEVTGSQSLGSVCPCQNGGTCDSGGDSAFTCVCQPGFSGQVCQLGSTDPNNVMGAGFVLKNGRYVSASNAAYTIPSASARWVPAFAALVLLGANIM